LLECAAGGAFEFRRRRRHELRAADAAGNRRTRPRDGAQRAFNLDLVVARLIFGSLDLDAPCLHESFALDASDLHREAILQICEGLAGVAAAADRRGAVSLDERGCDSELEAAALPVSPAIMPFSSRSGSGSGF